MSGEIVASGVDRTEGPRDFGYVVDWTADGNRFRFKAYAIVQLDGRTFAPSFLTKGYVASSDTTTCTSDAAISVSGFIKWDGCAELDFEDSPHWCGAQHFVQHIRLMAWLANKAAAVLPDHGCAETIRLDVELVRDKP